MNGRERAIKAEACLGAYLQQIDAREPDVQAWAWLERERAVEAARAVDSGRGGAGTLLGVPIGIKDVIDTADMPTSYGSPIYADHRPAADAAAVAALRNAGAIIVGKTVTCEFAGGTPSKTRNPLDTQRTPGGSSSGSAAAVAAGMVPVALGTQTAGSIIRPASFCGVVGYKPSYGLVNRAGLKPFSESLDTIGVFARTVEDAACVASVIAERPELAADDALPRPPRIAITRTDKWAVADQDAQQALATAADALRAAGGQLQDLTLPFLCSTLIEAGVTVIATDARRAFAHELRTSPDLVSQRLRDFIATGECERSSRYDSAQRLLQAQRRQLDGTVFSDFDALLTLSAPGEAPRDLQTTGDATFNFPWTLLQLPCINIPGLSGNSGMPIGVQLVGPYRGDGNLLRIARWAERALRGGGDRGRQR
jgi:amidase